NAQLSSPKRDYQLPAQHRNHKTQRKTKMPRVEGLLELFVRCVLNIITKKNHQSLVFISFKIIQFLRQ
ncbi:hypothetical protein, partial [Vibrio metschnikovii]|uniref:hypothetical protein n=1 Tax=Vibrio metschnikovii TaxID=28172 RepID=UPI0027DFA876